LILKKTPHLEIVGDVCVFGVWRVVTRDGVANGNCIAPNLVYHPQTGLSAVVARHL